LRGAAPAATAGVTNPVALTGAQVKRRSASRTIGVAHERNQNDRSAAASKPIVQNLWIIRESYGQAQALQVFTYSKSYILQRSFRFRTGGRRGIRPRPEMVPWRML